MKNFKRITALLIALALTFSLAACGSKETNTTGGAEPAPAESGGGASGKVMLYSSLKENQLAAIKEGFTAKYPDIVMDYYAAGTGKVMTKIATEQQSGQIAADLIWVGDPSNYIGFKEQEILEPYESPEAEFVDAKFKDPDNMYVGARLIVMGFTYNTNNVTGDDIPKNWNDLLDDKFKDNIVLSDPTESGTTLYAIAGLIANPDYGWDYIKALKANGAELESGTESTHNKVGGGAYKVCLGVDYVTKTLSEQGSTVAFSAPEKDLVAVSSPIALIKNSPNMENGKLLYDYILSEEGQTILANNQTTPIRTGIDLGDSISIEEINKRAMEVDSSLLVEDKEGLLTEFDDIFKK